MNPRRIQPLVRLLAGLATVLGSLLAAVGLALLWLRLFVPRTQMGWDALADFLGALMIGVVVGLLAAGLLIGLATIRSQLRVAAIAGVVGLAVLGGLAATAPRREPSPPVVIEKAFQPVFRVGLRVSHMQEILAGVDAAQRPLPFVEAEVSSGRPELVRVGWGPAFERCVATPSVADLERLVPLIQATADQERPYCRTPDEDLKLAAHWRVGQRQGNQGLEAGCLEELSALATLASAIDGLAQRLCPTG